MIISKPSYISTDVLVVGGGFAGMFAALRAAELGAHVVLVDKAYVSRSGASTMMGGITTAPFAGEDLTPWMEEFVKRGNYLVNQDRTRQLLEDQRERLRELTEWGIPIIKDQKGNTRRFLSRGMVHVRCLQFVPKETMEILRDLAVARGVKILDRMIIAELLTTDGEYPTRGRVCGAFGFHTQEGTSTVIQAKNTVLTTGHAHLRGLHAVNNDAGDGLRLAFNVGARLVDLEFGFGGTFNILAKTLNFFNYNVFVAHGGQMLNASGERFMEKHDPVRLERSELSRVVAAFLKEVLDGRGPVYMDFRSCDDTFWSDLASLRGKGFIDAMQSGLLPDPRTTLIPIEPQWSVSGLGGGLQLIDLDGHTSVPGLLGAGTLANNDALGTHQSAGGPSAFCFTSGHRAGETAAREAAEIPISKVTATYINELQGRVYAPLTRATGPLPDELQDLMLDIQGSALDAVVLNGTRFAVMLNKLDEVELMIRKVRAPDIHELVKAYDAESGFFTLRLCLISGQDRTESREMFYREDYPETNDEEWFCWHTLHLSKDGIVLGKQRIPIEQFPYKPPTRDHRLSPIAALMQGVHVATDYN